MKYFIFLVFIFISINNHAQKQLDIQGNPGSVATVASITVNYTGPLEVVGLEVTSEPQLGVGTGGSFYGGLIGVFGQSHFGDGINGKSIDGFGVLGTSTSLTGVHGISTSHYGVFGHSMNSTGAYFKGGGGIGIEIGGSSSIYGTGTDDAVIRSQVNQSSGDMILVSNDKIDFHLDDDNDSPGELRVKNGTNDEIFVLDESGNLAITGTLALSTFGFVGTTAVCINPSNIISSCSSSLRYKDNIISYLSKNSLLKDLRPVTFNWKESGIADFGLIAEEVAAIEPLLVTYNDKGQVEGVKYDRIGVILIDVMKEQQAEIDNLKKAIAEMKSLLHTVLKAASSDE